MNISSLDLLIVYPTKVNFLIRFAKKYVTLVVHLFQGPNTKKYSDSRSVQDSN